MKAFLAAAVFMAVDATCLPSPSGNATACDSNLCTWWLDSGEINTRTRVQPSNVRQSHCYNVEVRLAGTNDFRPSFVYESIPRNGNVRIYSLWGYHSDGTSGKDVDDGSSIESNVGITMAWSQFEYAQDVDVNITRRDSKIYIFRFTLKESLSNLYQLLLS